MQQMVRALGQGLSQKFRVKRLHVGVFVGEAKRRRFIKTPENISALLGASPGASTAAPITLNVLKQMFPQQFNSPEWQSRIHAIVPSYGQKLNGNVALTQQVWDDTAATLQLTKPPVIQMPAAAPTATAKPAETPREASPQHDMAL